MENQPQNFSREDEQKMLAEILKTSKQAKNFMKWQLIITIALVVIPLLAALFVIPYALKSLTELYSSSLIQ